MTYEIKGGDTAHELSTDIKMITAEINAYQRVAGGAIFEIGKRLKHVKENNLVHGEWAVWCESIGMNRSNAQIFIRVFEELGGQDVVTLQHLGVRALYEIAQMPKESRTEPHTLADGTTKTPDEMTVRELREVKRQLKEVEQKEREAVAVVLEAERRAEQARRSEEIAIQRLEEFENGTPEVEIRTEYVEVTDEEAKKRIERYEELFDRLRDIRNTTTSSQIA